MCIDDSKLPEGASIKEGNEYEVIEQYVNAMDQRVYIIKGVVNEGRTQFGLHWIGYRAERFINLSKKVVEIFEEAELTI